MLLPANEETADASNTRIVIFNLINFILWSLIVMLFMAELLQITEIGGDRDNLRLAQGARDRSHDGSLAFGAPLARPVLQFIDGVGKQLTGQPSVWTFSLPLGTMTGGAGWNVGFRSSLLEDLLAGGHEMPWTAPKGARIKTPELRGETCSHLRVHPMYPCHVYEERPLARVLGKGAQLILEVLGCLSREPRHDEIAMVALPRGAVAVLAIFNLARNPWPRSGPA